MHLFDTARRDRAPPTTAVPPTPVAPVGEPTPLLRHLAGEFAPRVAGLWPAPHADFVTAPAERRHLACIALGRALGARLGVTPRVLLELPLKQAIARVLPGAPAGLRRALGRLGEIAWEPGDYERLIFVLAQEAKDVRHAEAITPGQVRALAGLPAPLIRARIGGFALNEHQAKLLAEVYGTIQRLRGQEAAARAALRWSGMTVARDLFAAAEDDLLPDLPPAPFVGVGRLRPLTTKTEIRQAAARFRNCLRTRIPLILRGEAAIYEWAGTNPVCVEIQLDALHGWALSEARRADNAPVPEPDRSAIVADLKAMGVHVGRTSAHLRNCLENASEDWWVYPDDQDEFEIGWRFGGD